METAIKVDISKIDPSQVIDFIIAKPANQWIEEASQRPTPRKLYRELMFEGELAFLFATTGAGKSIQAVQIGSDLSQNEPVLYLDCELSDKQFQHRYTDDLGNLFRFNERFIRMELNPEAEKPAQVTEEDFLMTSIERCITESGAKILIIDNLTYLRSDTEKAKDALPLMKKLKSLKKKHSLSILVLAHTPKRDASKPITKNDLSGSIMLINFCDSAFAIGTSNSDPTIRYIKQIKARSTEIVYHEDNVLVFQIEKLDGFLQFSFIDYGRESNYLSNLSEAEKSAIEEMVKERHRIGKSHGEIANELKISRSKVQRILKKRDEKAPF